MGASDDNRQVTEAAGHRENSTSSVPCWAFGPSPALAQVCSQAVKERPPHTTEDRRAPEQPADRVLLLPGTRVSKMFWNFVGRNGLRTFFHKLEPQSVTFTCPGCQAR
eukprot:2314505-Rhodomonas_salina.1